MISFIRKLKTFKFYKVFFLDTMNEQNKQFFFLNVQLILYLLNEVLLILSNIF